jgi:hypothetical protein
MNATLKQEELSQVKPVKALVLIADDVPDSDGYAYRLTGRTIQDKVPVTIDSSVAYGSNVVHRHRAYCNCVGFASLELEGRKLYASFDYLTTYRGGSVLSF